MDATNQLIIGVKDANNTHTARVAGKTASCTHDFQIAAKHVVEKVWPGVEFTLREVPDNRPRYKSFVATRTGSTQ